MFNKITENDLFNDDNVLTEAELWDYAEYLNDNGIMPESIDAFPKKIERVISGDDERRSKIMDKLLQYWNDCFCATGNVNNY